MADLAWPRVPSHQLKAVSTTGITNPDLQMPSIAIQGAKKARREMYQEKKTFS